MRHAFRRALDNSAFQRACKCCCLLFPFVFTFAALAQEAVTGDYNGSLPTFADLLRQHRIQLTEPALIRALKSPNADVRYLSALELAENKNKDALPAIEAALAAETDPRNRANTAFSLGLLGSPTGQVELTRICVEEAKKPASQFLAIKYMFDLGVDRSEDCLHAAENIARPADAENETVGYRSAVFGLLAQFRKLSENDSQQVFDLLLAGLTDPAPYVRMEAGNALVTLGDGKAIRDLGAAISNEQDENVRTVLTIDLKSLRKKIQH